MVSAKRGAAQIGLIWIITFGVIALASIFFGYVSQDDKALISADLDEALAEVDVFRADFEEASNETRAISRIAGGYDKTSADTKSDPEALVSALDAFRETFDGLDPSIDNIADALPPAASAYRALLQDVATLNAQVQQLKSEVSTAQAQRTRDLSAKDTEISNLEQQLRDQQESARDREDDLQSQVARANDLADRRDQEFRDLERRGEETVRDLEARINELSSRLTDQGEKLAFLRPQAREVADATILSVSPDLGLAYIDIGSNQRLSRGVGFRIQANDKSGTAVKAYAEVTNVQANMAEIEISGLVDSFDPVVPGDVLINELYDPTGVRNAVLVGRFSGGLNESTLRALLDRMGIHVQDELSLTTDFAIVGSELYVDEFGEPYEEPLDPSELPVYGEAVALGVKIVPIQQVRGYFNFD